MGLYKKGGPNWYMAYSQDGQHFNRSTGTPNKRKAQRMLDSVKGNIADGRFNLLKSHAPTLKDWSQEFIDSIPQVNTRRRYACSKAALDDFFKEARLAHVTVSRIEQYKRER